MENITNNKNVFTKLPEFGDIVILDEANKLRFIKFGTYEANPLWTTIGVVKSRFGNMVDIAYKEHTSLQFTPVFRNRVLGWQLDNLDHTTTITFNSSMPKPSQPNFVYKATTIDEVVTQLSAWLATYSLESGKQYRCYKRDESSVYIIRDNWSNWYEYYISMSGLTVESATADELDMSGNIYAYNNTSGAYKGVNYEKYYATIHDATSETWNPTKPLEAISLYPVSFKCYMSEVGTYVRNIYGDGEEGYSKYLQDYMVEFPSRRSHFKASASDGHRNTYALAGQKYLAADGTMQPMYPAIDYCASIDCGHPALAAGKWRMDSMYELCRIYRELKPDYSDRFSMSMKAIGGQQWPFAYVWASSRFNSYNAWVFFGWSGYTYNITMYGSYCALPSCFVSLQELEEA